MPRTCLGCGQVGHRSESCKPKAAVEIRRLRSILENQVGARNNPGRKHRKTGYTQKACTKKKCEEDLYCGKTFPKRELKATWPGFRRNLQFSRVKITCWNRTKMASTWASYIDRLDAKRRADAERGKSKVEKQRRKQPPGNEIIPTPTQPM